MEKLKSNTTIVTEKVAELKKMFSSIEDVKLEQWKFSVENNKEGIRVELHVMALIKKPKEAQE